MKHQLIILGAIALLTRFLSILGVGVVAQSNAIAGNELKTKPARESISNYNSVLLNGRPLDYVNFSLASQGLLTVVIDDPETDNSAEIPFQIYLRRNGETIHQGASDTARSVLSIDVTTVLALAQPGDMLVIEPTRKSDASAGRRIKLKEFLFMPNLFSFLRNGKDGC